MKTGTLGPMLASVGTDVPTGEGWAFEPKYDGIRILAYVAGNCSKATVALLSRNGLDKTKQFPEVVDGLRALHAGAKRSFVLDGEIVAMNENGPLRFQELQSRMHVSDSNAIAELRRESPAAFIVFDLLMDGEASLVSEPWRERRTRLEALFDRGTSSLALQLSELGSNGTRMLERARRNGWEGIIAKRVNSPYAMGRRSSAWLKLKIEHRQEFVVGGWTEPRNSRQYLGALLLGYYDANGKLVYAGHTGTGFDRKTLRDVHTRLVRLERKSSPFTTTPKTNAPAHWARPSVVAEIRFNEWTTEGKLRQPVYLGLRDDKSAQEVIHEPESLAQPTLPGGRPRSSRRGGTSTSTRRRTEVAAHD